MTIRRSLPYAELMCNGCILSSNLLWTQHEHLKNDNNVISLVDEHSNVVRSTYMYGR